MIYRMIRDAVVFFAITGLIFGAFSPQRNVYAGAVQQPEYAGRLDAFLQAQMKTYKIPGLAVAIVRDGEVEYTNGYGTANAQGDPVTPGTPFLLASLSKSFTALGVMQLVEAGKIDLQDPVRDHLPWFTTAGQGSEAITVADLLYQTSGLSELGGQKMNLRPGGTEGLEAGVRALAHEKLNFRPGDGWEYSNSNYSVLGLLIQEVSGQSYESYVQENILDPLGMGSSYTSLSDARAGNAASGYYPFFGIPLVYDDYMNYTSASVPGAGLWSSAADMSRYLIAHLDEGRDGDAGLLSAAGMTKLHQPGAQIAPGYSYAMGWFHAPAFLDREFLKTLKTELNEREDMEVLWHEGDWDNYKSVMLILPGLEYGVVLLMNTNDPSIASVFRDFAWDATLIATGGEAYYFQPSEDPIVRYARLIFGGIVLLLLAGLVWSMTRWRRAGQSRERAWRYLLPLPFNLALLAYLHLGLLPDNDVDLRILLRSAPDMGLLAVLVTLLTLGWSLVSVLLFMRARRAQPARFTGQQAPTPS